MGNETSSTEGAMLSNGSPVMGTTASTGVTPEKTLAELEEARQRYAELEKKHANSTEELERHRKNAKKLADYEKAEQERQQAALSDIEKANQRATEAEQRIQQYQKQLVTTQVQFAAQKMGIINPELAALAIANKLELGDDGLPTNLDKALVELVRNNPYLVKQEKPAEPTAPETPAQQPSSAPAIPAMNPGRTSIQTPNASPPNGKPTRLSDIPWSR